MVLVHATTVIGIISKRFLVLNLPSKVPNVWIIVPSNYFSCKADFLNLGFLKSCQKFTGNSVMSEPVSTCMGKYFPFIFTFFQDFVGVFRVKISSLPLSICVSLSSLTFFVSAHLRGVIFSFANGACLTVGRAIIFSLTCRSPQYLYRIPHLFVLYASPSFGCWLYFFLLTSVAARTLYMFLLLN